MKIKDIKEQCSLSLKGNYIKALFIALFYTIINLIIQGLISLLENIFLRS